MWHRFLGTITERRTGKERAQVRNLISPISKGCACFQLSYPGLSSPLPASVFAGAFFSGTWGHTAGFLINQLLKKFIKNPSNSLVKCPKSELAYCLQPWPPSPSFNHFSSFSSCLQFCLIPSFLLSSLVFSWCAEICSCSRQAIIAGSLLAGPSSPLHCCSGGEKIKAFIFCPEAPSTPGLPVFQSNTQLCIFMMMSGSI